AEAFNASNASLGDVTAGTTFTISPTTGSCAGATCSATAPGVYTVTAMYSGKTTTATLNVNSPPSFTFRGFFSPVDMSTANQTVWNTLKAGQAVPLKWELTGNGAPISDPSSFAGVVSYLVACSSGAGVVDDAVEEFATGKSGLQYNGGGNWQFNWAT